MAAVPYMQFYIADYLVDTQSLTTLEHGAYLLLIMNYYQTGKSLVDDPATLAKFCRTSVSKWLRLVPTLAKYFTIRNGRWYHKRIEEDLDRIAKKSGKARVSAMIRWEKYHENEESENDANAMRTQCERNANAMRSEQNRTKQSRADQKNSSGRKKLPPELVEVPEDNFVSILLVDKTEFHVTEGVVLEFENCYPAVNVREQLKKMRAYFFANPKKRKTRGGVLRSVNSWLSNHQDSGSKRVHQGFEPRKLNNVEHNQLVLEKIILEEDEKYGKQNLIEHGEEDDHYR